MHIPSSRMVGDTRPRFDQPHDDPFDGPVCIFTPQIEPADQTEQVICEKTHLEPGFIRREPMTTCLIPTQSVLALLYSVLNITTSIVDFDHLASRKPGIGHDEIVPGKQFIKMPFDFGDHPPGLVPAFRLVLQVNILGLYPVLWWTTDRSSEVWLDHPCKHRIVPQPDEIGNPLVFAKNIDVRVRESRIAPKPEKLELLSVPGDDGLDEIKSAIR